MRHNNRLHIAILIILNYHAWIYPLDLIIIFTVYDMIIMLEFLLSFLSSCPPSALFTLPLKATPTSPSLVYCTNNIDPAD
jgi:hypothetical protein